MHTPYDNRNSNFRAPLPWQIFQWQRLSSTFESNQLAHAYLFSGNKGLGKGLFAKAFANLMLCQEPLESSTTSLTYPVPCGHCTNCRKGGSDHHPDIIEIEPEEGSKNIKIDQIRSLSDFVIRSSHAGGAKVAIIHSAHLLNGNAANALLKTLEEPNNNTHVFLITDFPGRLIATIRSRCQRLDFANPDHDLAANWLHQILGEGNIEALLKASNNSPLIALQLAEGDSLQFRQQFLQSICAIQLGRSSIQSSLLLASKIGESEVLQHFAAFLTTLTKYTLTGIQGSEGDAAAESMYAVLKPTDDIARTQFIASALLDLYTEVETSRKQLSSSTNPNPQLLMESLLWRWSKLPLHTAMS